MGFNLFGWGKKKDEAQASDASSAPVMPVDSDASASDAAAPAADAGAAASGDAAI